MKRNHYNDQTIWLAYRDSTNEIHYQPIWDLVQSGTLIDPETGEDMELVGWAPHL